MNIKEYFFYMPPTIHIRNVDEFVASSEDEIKELVHKLKKNGYIENANVKGKIAKVRWKK